MQLHAIMQLNCSRGYSGLHNTDEKDKDPGKTEMHSSEKPLLWGVFWGRNQNGGTRPENIHRPHRRNYFLGDPTKKSFTNFSVYK